MRRVGRVGPRAYDGPAVAGKPVVPHPNEIDVVRLNQILTVAAGVHVRDVVEHDVDPTRPARLADEPAVEISHLRVDDRDIARPTVLDDDRVEAGTDHAAVGDVRAVDEHALSV